MLNTGLEISIETGDALWFQHTNEVRFYEGASDSTTQTLTIHGDGDHSAFDPYVTLHEGFKTGNGTDTTPLICNIGKGAQIQWNDGTASSDVFHMLSVVNGAGTFQRMETSFQQVEHFYTEIRNFQWYFADDTANSRWEWYDSSSSLIMDLQRTGDLTLAGFNRSDGGFSYGKDPTLGRVVDVLGPSNQDCELDFESGDNTAYDVILNLESENSWELISEHFDTGIAFGRFIIKNNTSGDDLLYFYDAGDIHVPSAIDFIFENTTFGTTGDYWELNSNTTSDNFQIRYYNGSTYTNIIVIDQTSNEVTISDSLKCGTVDVTTDLIVPAEFQAPSCAVGLALAQTVTASDAVIPLTAINVDGSGSEYTIDTAGNEITFDGADGSKIYEVSFYCRYDLDNMATTGSTRSYAVATPRINAVAQTDYESWSYIREWQGGTNGLPNDGTGITFMVQPALNDSLDFVVRAVTDTGTITDFEIDGIVVTIKRVQ